MSSVRWLLSVFLVSILAQTALAQSLTGADLDGDKSPDFVLVNIGSDQSLSLSAYSSLGSAMETPVDLLGKAGDHLAVANWASKDRSNLGFIRAKGSKAIWYIVNDQGQLKSKVFGKKSNTFLSGGDFNGNGYADAAVVQGSGAWIVRHDYFRNINGGKKPSTLKTFHFGGKSGDLYFFANYGGKGDWAGVMRSNPSGPGAQIIIRSVASGKQRSFKVLDYTPGSIRPLPIRQANGKDILALIRLQTSSTIVKFVNLHGGDLGTVELPVKGEVLVGNYSAAPGQELAIQTDDGFFVYNPITQEQSTVAVPAGIPIDDVNINKFAASNSSESCNDETLSPFDGSDGFLWKVEGEHSKKLVVLFPSIWTGKIDEVVLRKPSGVFIEKATLAWITAPGARTFARFSKSGKKYPAGVRVVAHLSAGCYKTYVIDDPTKRND